MMQRLADPGDEMILLLAGSKKIRRVCKATHLTFTRTVNDHLKGLQEIEVITPLPVPG